MKFNKLTVKGSKSKLLIFSKSKADAIYFADTCLQPVASCKYLGIELDNKLSFKDHIEIKRKKLTRFCGVAYRLRNVMTISQMVMYYKTYVQPCVQYGVLVYGAVCKSALDVIHKLLKRFFRITFRKSYCDSITEIMAKSKIASVYELHVYEILKKIVNEELSQKCETIFYSTRSSVKGARILPSMKSKLKYNSVSHRVAKLISILANCCVTIPSSFDTHHSKNDFCHSILDSYIIGNCHLIDELYR